MDERRQSPVEGFFVEHRRRLLAYFRKRIRRKPDAHDLIQELYVRLSSVRDPDAIRNPQAYVYRVASNLLRESYQQQRRDMQHVDVDGLEDLWRCEVSEGSTLPDLIGGLPLLEDSLEREQQLEFHLRTVERMHPKMRAAMLMKYRHGLSYAEIAEAMEISTSMVKKHLTMGLTICRMAIEPRP